MPRIQSSKKRMRQTVARTAQNRQKRSALRTAIKRVRNAETAEAAAQALARAEALLDRAGRKRLIHPNTAARYKRRLVKVVATKGA